MMLIVTHRLGMSNLFECELNSLEEQIANMITRNILASATNNSEDNRSKSDEANSTVSLKNEIGENTLACSDSITSSTDESEDDYKYNSVDSSCSSNFNCPTIEPFLIINTNEKTHSSRDLIRTNNLPWNSSRSLVLDNNSELISKTYTFEVENHD